MFVGGFHLAGYKETEISDFSNKLKEEKIDRIYTGHCTGNKAFIQLKKELVGIIAIEQTYCGETIDIK